MTESKVENPIVSFVQRRLPWIIAAAMFVFFAVTLNFWVTAKSLPVVAKVTGWDWNTTISQPVLYLLTYPFRFLPPDWQPIALNLLSALLAALTLGVLAKSVALLPHNRTREQRQRERDPEGFLSIKTAWVPPVFAALVCGLQLTFWEHATALTGEMLNLLIFAYIIRCLLQIRVDDRPSWVSRLGFLYGLAITNNWAMLGFLPVFAAALVWIVGRKLFSWPWLSRLLGYAGLGLLFYLLIPLVELFSTHTEAGFIQLLRSELGSQKMFLLVSQLRNRAFILSFTSLVPLILIGIRWPSTFGDTSVFGNAMTAVMFRVLHGVFLVVCAFVAFDPAYSPRNLGMGLSFLSFYYMGALALGYFSGYFLLVCGKDPARSRNRPGTGLKFLNRALAGLVLVAVIGVPAGLFSKNWPYMSSRNQNLLHQFAHQSVKQLPDEQAVVLSDNKLQMLLVEAALADSPEGPDHIFLESELMPHKLYHRTMGATHPEIWPKINLTKLEEPIPSPVLISFLARLDQKAPLYYLQPSFGYYFERFYQEPHGSLFRLTPYDEGKVTPPKLSKAEVKANDAFWEQFDFSKGSPLLQSIELDVEGAKKLGRFYSRNLNFLGVRLQRSDHFERAGHYFKLASRLNPENVASHVNLQVNKHLRSGSAQSVKITDKVGNMLGQYRNWEELLRVCGPVDAPNFCFNLGKVLAKRKLHRQAAQQFRRTVDLQPEHMEARFWLAEIYLRNHMPDRVLAVTKEIKELSGSSVRLTRTNRIDLVQLEAWAHFDKKETKTAEKLLKKHYNENPENHQLLSSLAQLYLRSGNTTNALKTIEQQLKSDPKDVQPLLVKSYIFIEQEKYSKALPPLNQALQLEPGNIAGLFNRGLAYFNLEQWENAKEDYTKLLEKTPNNPAAHYRLAEIYYQEQNKTKAVDHYQAFLENTSQSSEKAKTARKRLKELAGYAALPDAARQSQAHPSASP